MALPDDVLLRSARGTKRLRDRIATLEGLLWEWCPQNDIAELYCKEDQQHGRCQLHLDAWPCRYARTREALGEAAPSQPEGA